MGKIIVTGSSGFIGSNLIRVLNENDMVTIGISRRCSLLSNDNNKYIELDLTLNENIDLLYKIKDVSAIVHCAGNSINNNESNCLDTIDLNLKLTSTLLSYAIKNNIPKFIYLSSNKVTMDDYYSSAYSLSKKMCEDMIYYCNYRYKKNYLSLRLCNIYGKDRNKNRIIPFLIEGIINNKNIITNSSLLEEINFCSVDVIVNLISLILKDKIEINHVMDIIPEFSVSILELKEVLSKLVLNIDDFFEMEELSICEIKLLPIVDFYYRLFKSEVC